MRELAKSSIWSLLQWWLLLYQLGKKRLWQFIRISLLIIHLELYKYMVVFLSNWDHREKDFCHDSFLYWSPEAYSNFWELSCYLGFLGIIAIQKLYPIVFEGLFISFFKVFILEKNLLKEEAATQYLKENAEFIACYTRESCAYKAQCPRQGRADLAQGLKRVWWWADFQKHAHGLTFQNHGTIIDWLAYKSLVPDAKLLFINWARFKTSSDSCCSYGQWIKNPFLIG